MGVEDQPSTRLLRWSARRMAMLRCFPGIVQGSACHRRIYSWRLSPGVPVSGCHARSASSHTQVPAARNRMPPSRSAHQSRPRLGLSEAGTCPTMLCVLLPAEAATGQRRTRRPSRPETVTRNSNPGKPLRKLCSKWLRPILMLKSRSRAGAAESSLNATNGWLKAAPLACSGTAQITRRPDQPAALNSFASARRPLASQPSSGSSVTAIGGG